MAMDIALPLIALLTLVATVLNAAVAVVVMVLRNQVNKSTSSIELVHSSVNGNLERLEGKLSDANSIIITLSGKVEKLESLLQKKDNKDA